MFSFLRTLTARGNNPTPKRRSSPFRLCLEALEDRQLLSIAASAVDPNAAYVVTNNQNLYYYQRDGAGRDHWAIIDSKVAQVSIGRDSVGDNTAGDVLFDLNTDGSLWEHRGTD